MLLDFTKGRKLRQKKTNIQRRSENLIKIFAGENTETNAKNQKVSHGEI